MEGRKGMEQDIRGSQGRREEGRAHTVRRQRARLVTYPNSFPSPRSPVGISSPHTDAGTEAHISVTSQGPLVCTGAGPRLGRGWAQPGAPSLNFLLPLHPLLPSRLPSPSGSPQERPTATLGLASRVSAPCRPGLYVTFSHSIPLS